MPRKKTTPELETPGGLESPGEFTISDAPNDQPDQPQAMTYVGPAYDKGIQLGGTRDLIRPAEFTREEITAFLEQHPNRSHWWLPSEKL